MTNAQLWIAIAIPSLLVVLCWIQQTTRMTRLEAQNDELRRDMNALGADIRRDIVTLRGDLNRDMLALRDSIHRDMVGLHERVAVVEAKQQ